jgi:ketosteroid isomerase-like protein
VVPDATDLLLPESWDPETQTLRRAVELRHLRYFVAGLLRGQIGMNALTPEEAVRAYFAAYSDARPERLEELVSPDYVDYGHTLPGHGPRGARDDYEHAVQVAGGVIQYDIVALVAGKDTVAVTWTGHLPNGSDYRGLSLYRVARGRITEARITFIDLPPD